MSANPLAVAVAALVGFLACSSPERTSPAPASKPVPASQQPAPPPPTASSPTPQRLDTFAPVRLGDPQELAYGRDFFPDSAYDAAIAPCEDVLGVSVGTRPAHHAEVEQLWNLWAAASPRVRVEVTGHTWEGRALYANVVSSPANLARLSEIRAGIARLADPRGLSQSEENELVSTLPAIAWLGYSIHGDEMSGVDGGLAVAYHLIAGTGPEVTELLDELVIVFDPMLNPDGRERFLAMLGETAGAVPSLDYEALQRGRWPWGRGNHYLFDMNRDWMAGIAPETRARWKAALTWHPQLFVDAHEMGGFETFLFYPPREPINRNVPDAIRAWWQVFGDDQARAFDRYGWSYYTREWAEYWYPGYSDSWGTLNGAVGILYEQARFDGQPLKRPAGDIATYREAAHHQAVSSLANLTTLANNRAAVLRDWANGRRASCEAHERDRAFVFVPGRHPERARFLAETLIAQGIEVFRSDAALEARELVASSGEMLDVRELPAGAYVVPVAQPQGALLRAYLDFDPRIDEPELLLERKELETKGQSRIYDVTAWNFAQALDLESWWCKLEPPASAPLVAVESAAGGIEGSGSYGWVVDGNDDRSVAFASRALALGVQVNYAEHSFTAGGASFPRGSLLVRKHENLGTGTDGPLATERAVERAAYESGVRALAIASARSPDDGPDLGAPRFRLLAEPRLALVSNMPISPEAFGHLWHQCDRELGLAAAQLDAQTLSQYDLRRFNVLVLPPSYGIGDPLKSIAEDLKAWVRSGGTLIAIGNSAAALADEKLGLSEVRRRADVLEKLAEWKFAAQREAAARAIAIDAEALWNPKPPAKDAEKPAAAEEKPKEARDPSADPDLKRQEEWMQRFAPAGATLRALVDEEHWITAGSGGELPVHFDGATALYSRAPVETPLRLASSEKLRLAGLLWPEARERLEGSAYLTVEHLGKGQVILFAAQPGFRGYHKATARLLANAIVYGPGLGADQPVVR